MTYPTAAVTTTNLDAGTDSPATARSGLLDAVQKLNQMIAHTTAFAATLLDDVDAAAARGTLGAAKSGANTDITSLGAVTGVTASAGNSSANLATTAFVQTEVPAASTSAVGKLRFATSGEAQALVSTAIGLSPGGLAAALQGANISLAASGYQKLPGGLIIQWATGSAVANANQTVTYPLTFPTAALAVLHSGKGAYTYSNATTSLVSFSASSAVIQCFDSQNGANTCVPTIIAIGY